MDGKFYTVSEFAKKLNVPESSIRKSIRFGRLHAFRPGIGKRSPYRIYESELTRILMVPFEEIMKEKGK
jgi:excisionase family DNA binding protein